MFICLAIGFLFGLTANQFRFNALPIYLVFTTGITSLTGLACFLMKMAANSVSQVGGGESSQALLQFHVRHMLIWMTMSAVLIAVFQWALQASDRVAANRDLLPALALLLIFAAMAVVDVWVVTGGRNPVRVSLWIVAFFLGSGTIVSVVPGHRQFWLVVTCCTQVMLVFSIYSLQQQEIPLIHRIG